MNKKIISVLLLGAAICAPQASAMNPANMARFVRVAGNAAIKASITQPVKSAITSEAGSASRTITMQAATMPANKRLVAENLGITGSSKQRAMSIAKPVTNQSRSTLAQKTALGVGAVGLAGAIGGTVMYMQEKDGLATPLPKDFTIPTDAFTLLKMMQENPELITLCTDLVLKDFATYANSPSGCQVIKLIMERNPQSVSLFADVVAKDFLTVVNKTFGYDLIKAIMDNNPQSVSLFAPYAAENIVQLARTLNGERLLHEIMAQDSKSAILFAESAVKNLDALLEYYSGEFLVQKIVAHDCRSILTSFIAQRVESLVVSDRGCSLLATLVADNSETAALIAPIVLKNAATMLKISYGYRLLVAKIMNNPAFAVLLISTAIENITTLADDYYGIVFLKNIMNHNPDSQALFAQATRYNCVELLKQNYGYAIIAIIMNHNAEYKAEIINVTINNFKSLIKMNNGRCSIAHLTHEHPELAARCAEMVIDTLVELADDRFGHNIIENIMQHNPAPFIEASAKNIVVMMENDNQRQCLEKMMVNHPGSIPVFAAAAAQNLVSMLETNNGFRFVKDILRIDKTINGPSVYVGTPNGVAWPAEASALIARQAIADCVELAEKDNGLELLMYLMKQDSAIRKELQEKFKESRNKGDRSKASSFAREIFDKIIDFGELTPTELGFMYTRNHLKKHMETELNKEPVQRAVKEVIDIEKEYQKTHYTFVHGRNFAYNFREMVYRNLWEYAHNTKVPSDFRFTHTKEEHDPLMKDLVIMPEEKKLHERNITVLENGRSEELRNRRLFLNTQLFGNLKVGGSSSFSYFIRNSNASHSIKLSIEDVFGQFGQKELYEQYKERFKALDQEHRALTEYGELLVVAVPRNRVHEDVQTIEVRGGATEFSTFEVLEAREADPSFQDNELNFTLAMTDTAALDPKSGIKVRSVHAVEPEKYAEWQAKYDALMSELEAEFKQNWKRSLKAKDLGNKELLAAANIVKKHHDAKHKKNTDFNVNK